MTIRRRDSGEIIGERKASTPSAASASIKPGSFKRDADGNRTITVVLSDERTNTVPVRDWWTGRRVDEQLSLDPAHVRLERINNGAPFLILHRGRDEKAQIGKFIEGGVRIEGEPGSRQLLGDVIFSNNLDEDGERHVADIEDGIRRNVSVGWREHETIVTERAAGPDHHFVVDWEPMEGSSVPMGADDGAVTRGAEPQNFPPKRRKRAMGDENKTKGAEPTGAARYTAEELEELANKRAEKIAAEKAKKLAKQQRAAEKARAAKIKRLGTVLRLSEDDVNGWLDETDEDGELVPYDTIQERAFEKAAKREEKPENQTRSGVSVEAGSYDEADIRGLRMMGYLLCHRGGFSQARVKKAIKSNGEKGRRFVAPNFDVDGFDFMRESRDYMAHNMLALARAALEADGFSTRGMGPGQIADAALGYMYGRGLNTTSSFPLLLAETLNTSVRIGFEEVPLTFQRWSTRTTSQDFRTKYTVTMGETQELEELGEKGEYATSTMKETREGYKLVSYGRIFGMTRELIINDRLSGITRIPRKLGSSANRKMRAVTYGVLTDNNNLSDATPLFDASRGNVAGSPAVPSVASIDEMRVRMSTRTGLETGVTTPHMLKHLICSEKWRTRFEQVLGITRTPGRSDGAGINEQVPESFAGYMVTSDPLLDSYNAGGGVGNAWFGAAADDTVEHAFLEGEEGVQIAVKEGFEVSGLMIRAHLDFGAGPIDWRGLDRDAGAAS